MARKPGKLFVIMAAILPLTTASVEAAAADFKGTIKIANVGDYSGPAAKGSGAMRDAIQDYTRYLNESKGGIAGYKLEVEPFDSKFDLNVMLAAYKRYFDQLKVKFMFSEVAGALPTSMKLANQKKFVLMATSGHPKYTILSKEDEQEGKENYFFIHTPVIVTRMASAVEWIKQDWKSKGKTGIPKIAGFNFDNEGGHMAATAARIYTERAGFTWMGSTYSALRITNAVSQVAVLKKWDVDYILGAGGLGQALTVFVKELQRMKFNPIVMHHSELGTAYLETKDPAFEGHLAYQYTLDWPNTENEEVARMHALNKKWHPEVKFRMPLYVSAWHGAMIFSEALRRAVVTYGVDNMSGPNIKAAFETIKDFDVGGLSSPVSYSKADHQGSHSLRWVRCEKGRLVPVGPFVKGAPFTDEERNYNYWLKD
jgi:branched-chain amino acid transport system substrate-binding protein